MINNQSNSVTPKVGFLLQHSPRHVRNITNLKPETPVNLNIRGNDVAVDLIIKAFVQQRPLESCEFFAQQKSKEFSQACLREYINNRDINIQVNSLDSLTSGLDQYQLKVWFSPYGGMSLPLQLRTAFARRIYPVTSLIHGFSYPAGLYDWFTKILLSGTYAFDSIICTSRACQIAVSNIFTYLQDSFKNDFGIDIKYEGRLDLIPLCIDVDSITPEDKMTAREHLNLPLDSFIFLYFGRVCNLKADLSPLIEVYSQLVKAYPHRKLLLVIAGTENQVYMTHLLSQIQTLNLNQNVTCIFNLTEGLKSRLFSASDVFISPADSVQESFGITPVEALAHGLPQIVTDWNGYRDTVSHEETGFLIPTYISDCFDDLSQTFSALGWEYSHHILGQAISFDHKEMYNCMQTMIENDDLRKEMGIRSRRRAESKYSFSAVTQQYEDLWKDLISSVIHLESKPFIAGYERPAYFDFYGHYASKQLTDNSVIRLTLKSINHFQQSEPLPQFSIFSKHSDFRIFNHDLLNLILYELYQAQIHLNCKTYEIGKLISNSREKVTVSDDLISRHIGWLLKQGFIEVVSI